MFITTVLHAVVATAHSAVEGLAGLLTPGIGGFAAAAAIVLFTVLVRLLVSPLSWLQARAAKRGAALTPQIARLREKHRDDPVALAAETLALQRANGAGPGMSLLPALVQAPFFMIMFELVRPGPGPVSGLLAGDFLGVPLTAHFFAGFPVFVGLLGLATALAVWSSGRARAALAASTAASAAAASAAVAAVAKPAGSKAKVAVGSAASGQSAGLVKAGRAPGVPENGSAPDVLASAGKLMTYLPYLTILVVAYMPLAGAIYLVTSTAWSALEQALWRRPVAATNP